MTVAMLHTALRPGSRRPPPGVLAAAHRRRRPAHDFTDEELDTRFLGDSYQDPPDHAKKTYALLQTLESVEEFILDLTSNPRSTTARSTVQMIDPACGSGSLPPRRSRRILARWCRPRPRAWPPRPGAERPTP